MIQSLEAIFENGMLRPMKPLDLKEHQIVTVVVQDHCEEPWLDTDFLEASEDANDAGPSLQEVRLALSKMAGELTNDFIAEREDR